MKRKCIHLKLWYFVMEHSRSIIYITSFLTFKRTICWPFDEVERKHPVYRYVLFNRKRLNIWRSTNDTKKCLRQKLYGIAGNIQFRIALLCIVYLVTTLKRPARVTSEFLFFIPSFLITYSCNLQSNVFKTLQICVFRTMNCPGNSMSSLISYNFFQTFELFQWKRTYCVYKLCNHFYSAIVR